MRMIDADALTEHIFPMPFSEYEKGWNDALFAAAEKCPTIDAVPVVRCGECAVPNNRWTGCPKMNGTIMPPDGFCSYGERR